MDTLLPGGWSWSAGTVSLDEAPPPPYVPPELTLTPVTYDADIPTIGESTVTGETGTTALDPPVFDLPAPAWGGLPTTWEPIPDGMTTSGGSSSGLQAMIWRHSESYPTPTVDAEGRPINDLSPTVVEEPWGQLRVVIEGVDRSVFRGAPTIIEQYTLQDPFGCGPGRLRFPALRPWEAAGYGSLSWLAYGHDVDIVRLHPDGSTTTVLWSGQILSFEWTWGEDQPGLTVNLCGDLWAANYQHCHQAPYLPPTDLGTLVTDTLNTVVSRKYNRAALMAAPTVGKIVTRRAAQAQGRLEYVQELLSLYGTLADGSDQWTVGRVVGSPRVYEMRLRGSGTTTWTVMPGGRTSGRLSADGTQIPSIYYASGVNDNGYGWAGWLYPGGVNAIETAWRAPFAYDPRTFPFRYHSQTGAYLGPEPLYEPRVIPNDADWQMGSGTSKAEAFKATRATRAKVPSAGWSGTISLQVDPVEGSRFDIREGDWISIPWFHNTFNRVGSHLKVRVMQVQVSRSETDVGTVTCTVDQLQRDLVTLSGALAQDESSINDPTRMPDRPSRAARLRQDRTVAFDGESLAGHVLTSDLKPVRVPSRVWTHVDVPVSQVGKVALVDLRTNPKTPFCVAFFGDLEVTAAEVTALVGDPLLVRSDGYGPFDVKAAELEALGFVQAIGGPGQAAGYSRLGTLGDGYETSPYTGQSTVLTGRLYATGTWSYTSTKPPYVRVFFWCVAATSITGRLLPAPLDL